MGQLDQFAKQLFAEETEQVTGGAALWQPPLEMNLTEVRLDGMLLVRDPARLLHLPAPWCLAAGLDEVVFENKMQGDHVGMPAVQRALLRRQARQVQRAEDPKSPWEGEEALWIAAAHVPKVLATRRDLVRTAPGCYQVGPASFPFLWIAANELPLEDALIPFLIARSGRALDEFCLWVRTRRPAAWLMRMVEFLPMSAAVLDEMLRFVVTKTDDPEIKARQKRMVKVLVDATPEARDELVQEAVDHARLAEARGALRSVLARRKLEPSPEDEARINGCVDLPTLNRWHDQAVDSPSVADALR